MTARTWHPNWPRRTVRTIVAGALALALAAAFLVASALGGRSTTAPADDVVAVAAATRDDPAAAVTALQKRLATQPKDARGWATLALGQVELARSTADPSWYPRAADAVRRATALRADDDLVRTATAALLAARHDFAGALRAADAALTVNPDSALATAVRADALTELGRYAEARAAALRADGLQPGLTSTARLSYQAELRGDLRSASRLMGVALADARRPADVAFAAAHLADLRRAAGDLAGARAAAERAVAADPTSTLALAARARCRAAAGDLDGAERDLRAAVARAPVPELVVELGELLLARGRTAQAGQQWDLVRAAERLAAASGVGTDLSIALFEADHGAPAAALTAARREHATRPSSIVAQEALGWALARTGSPRAGMALLRSAYRMRTADPRLLLRLGLTELAAGDRSAARAHLATAVELDAGGRPWLAQQARAALGDAR